MTNGDASVVSRRLGLGGALAFVLFVGACGESAGGGKGSGGSGGKAPAGGSAGSSGKGGGGTGGSGGASGGATASGGKAGSSGAGGGTGGSAAGDAGRGGASGGKAGGSGRGGTAGSAGSGGSGGDSGEGGTPSQGGSAGSQGGMGGETSGNVEYRACERGGGFVVISVYRIDREASVCTLLAFTETGGGSCALGITSSGFCLAQARASNDVAACESLMVPNNPVAATAASGTFSITTSIQANLDLTFPAGSGVPETVSVELSGCAPNCAENDCRD